LTLIACVVKEAGMRSQTDNDCVIFTAVAEPQQKVLFFFALFRPNDKSRSWSRSCIILISMGRSRPKHSNSSEAVAQKISIIITGTFGFFIKQLRLGPISTG
jgi:hypothetical protein